MSGQLVGNQVLSDWLKSQMFSNMQLLYTIILWWLWLSVFFCHKYSKRKGHSQVIVTDRGLGFQVSYRPGRAAERPSERSERGLRAAQTRFVTNLKT